MSYMAEYFLFFLISQDIKCVVGIPDRIKWWIKCFTDAEAGTFFLIKNVNKVFVCPAANEEKNFQDFYAKHTTLMGVSYLCLTEIFYYC